MYDRKKKRSIKMLVTPKVELHVHLDGALKHTTAWELLKKKNLHLPGNGSYEAFLDSIIVKEPDSLMTFLRGFGIFLPAVIGDLEAIERMSYEFCESAAEQGVIYVEARYCPFLLMPDSFTEANFLSQNIGNHDKNGKQISTKEVVEAVNKGFQDGERQFGTIARTILCCIRGKPEWSKEILDLCIQFKDQGVVGIDIAGDEAGEKPIPGEESELRMLDAEDIAVFEKAAELGIHRTVHAGEAGPAQMVWKALTVLKAERIGHGYRVLEDDSIYNHCLNKGVHFECCPTSSMLTGSVSICGTKTHPIMRFAQDGASFSISTDDPTVTNTNLSDEYALCAKWGLTIAQLQETNINAMKNSFAEPSIKQSILEKLYSAYGLKNQN